MVNLIHHISFLEILHSKYIDIIVYQNLYLGGLYDIFGCTLLPFRFAQSGKKYLFIRKMQQLLTNPNKIMFVLTY